MPKDSKKGELLLSSVKNEQTRRQTERTALAVGRHVSSSVEAPEEEVTPSPSTATEADVLWERTDFLEGKLIVFARGHSEAITLRKSPQGPGWYIDFGGCVNHNPNKSK